jgi:hypothetical protein
MQEPPTSPKGPLHPLKGTKEKIVPSKGRVVAICRQSQQNKPIEATSFVEQEKGEVDMALIGSL